MKGLSLCLLAACLSLALAEPQYYNCPPGYQLNADRRCERIRWGPQELHQQSCPPGFKHSRGICSKMTEREIELDRLPKEPCPPGERKSRLVCRPYP